MTQRNKIKMTQRNKIKMTQRNKIKKTQRNKIKNWLLHLDQDDLEFFITIARERPWCDRYKNGNHFTSGDLMDYISDEYGLNGLYQLKNYCIDELGIDYDEKSDFFPDLCYALVAWLSYPKNVKAYKVLAKINDLNKDFTTNP